MRVNYIQTKKVKEEDISLNLKHTNSILHTFTVYMPVTFTHHFRMSLICGHHPLRA